MALSAHPNGQYNFTTKNTDNGVNILIYLTSSLKLSPRECRRNFSSKILEHKFAGRAVQRCDLSLAGYELSIPKPVCLSEP